MKEKFVEIIKDTLVNLHGIESCKKLASMPSTELTFSILRKRVENEYSKYKSKLSDEQYECFIEDIFQIYKEYKLSLDKVNESQYGQVYGDYAEKTMEIKHKYGIYAK